MFRFLADEDISQLEGIARVLPEVVLFPCVAVDDLVRFRFCQPPLLQVFTFCAVDAESAIR